VKTLTVARHELAAYFLSPVAYLVATLFLLVQGYSFWLFVRVVSAHPTQHGAVLQYFFGGTVLFWFFVMFLCSVLTMRLVAEEKSRGTLEPLLTAPVGEGSVVIGKYLGCLLFYLAMFAPTLVYVLLLSAFGARPDAGPVASGYLGTLLVSSSALALGLLASTVTRNQILAAVLAFVALCLLLLLGPLGSLVSGNVAAILSYVDLFGHMEELGRGIVDSRRIVYHASLVVFALFLATRLVAVSRNRARALVEAALLAFILLGANLLSARHYLRGDWTRSHTFALSEKTNKTLRSLARDVDVIVFMLPTGQDKNDLYGDVHELLERARRLTPRLHVQYVDPDRERERLRIVGKKYGVSGDDLVDGVIVVAAGEQSKFITRSDLGDFDFAAVEAGRPPPLKAWKGEQALLSALYAVTDERAPAVCFVGGDGEPAIEGGGSDDYSDFAEELRRDHEAPRAISLDRGVPSDCDAVVLAGPSSPLAPPDAVELDRYLEHGGRLLALIGPTFDPKVTRFVSVGVEDLLRRWGAALADNVAVDEPRLRGSAVAFAVTEGYADHPITRRLSGEKTLWSDARAVHPAAKNGIEARPLVSTSESGWGETDLGIFRAEAELAFDPGRDEKGPVTLAVAAERTAGTGKGARLVVFGSSEIASNRSFVYNHDLMMSALHWLEHREDKIAIGPRPAERARLVLDDAELERVFLVCVVGLPLFVVVAGGLVFWRRRR
jgi:ABC-2 type transport system permease protein